MHTTTRPLTGSAPRTDAEPHRSARHPHSAPRVDRARSNRPRR